MAGRYGRRYRKDEDFDEGEVWGVMEESENTSSVSPKLRKPIKKHDISSSRHHVSAARMIPRSSSSSLDQGSNKQFSAPLDIPDWSKIYGKSSNSKKKNINMSSSSSSHSWVNNHDDGSCYANGNANGNGNGNDDHYYYGCGYGNGNDDVDDEDDDDDGMVPPHEFLARKLARSQISSFSVYEGIGRTLKGRDLSKLRNAILTKTGFLE